MTLPRPVPGPTAGPAAAGGGAAGDGAAGSTTSAPAARPWWDAPDPSGWRVVLPAAAALMVQVGAAGRGGPRDLLRHFGRGDLRGPDVDFVFTLGLAVAGPLLLLAARIAPGPVVAGVTGITLMDVVFADQPGRIPIAALAVAVVSAVARGARVWAWVSVAAGFVLALALSPFVKEDLSVGQIGFATVLLIVSFGVGEAIRAGRLRRAETLQADERRHETAVRAERERIARELHDVLAHSLSQISVQAGVGLHLSGPGRPESLVRAREALTHIRTASGTALDDVRSVIGALRSPGEAPLAPAPGLDRLEKLLESARDAGLQASLTTDAAASVPRAVQAAAYRIVQEALTNTLRHARATMIDVTVTADADSVTVEVIDDGVATAVPVRPGGLGLSGMAERAALLGGSLEAGPRSAGGWRVTARLPYATAANKPA